MYTEPVKIKLKTARDFAAWKHKALHLPVTFLISIFKCLTSFKANICQRLGTEYFME